MGACSHEEEHQTPCLNEIAALNTAPHSNKEKSKDKNGFENKEERALFKNKISAATERRREIEDAKKDPILERGGKRVYVLYCMVVTFPTCHAERSPLKTVARRNTAPQQQRKVQG